MLTTTSMRPNSLDRGTDRGVRLVLVGHVELKRQNAFPAGDVRHSPCRGNDLVATGGGLVDELGTEAPGRSGDEPDAHWIALVRRSYSSSVSSTCAAAMFCSTWATVEVPGIGSMTGERRSSQARASCEGWRRAGGDLVQRAAGLGQAAGREREPRDEGDAVLLGEVEQGLGVAVARL